MEKIISEKEKNIDTKIKTGKSSNSVNTSRIKELREKMNLTQEAFAEQVGMSLQMISKMERGEKGLYIDRAIEISKHFNVSLDWLYELSDDTKDTASNIVDNLRSVFDIDLENKTINIVKELADFIQELSLAYKTKSEQKMPDVAFKYWIDGIKNEFNEIMKEKSGKETHYVKYYLQTVEEHLREKEPRQVMEDFSPKHNTGVPTQRIPSAGSVK